MNIGKGNIIFDIKKDLKWSEEVQKFINKLKIFKHTGRPISN